MDHVVLDQHRVWCPVSQRDEGITHAQHPDPRCANCNTHLT